MIRWFQFGALSPLMRLYGFRDPGDAAGPGDDRRRHEVWSYGEETGGILARTADGTLARHLLLRERLRTYILNVMREAHEERLPAMRPLFLEFPDEPDGLARRRRPPLRPRRAGRPGSDRGRHGPYDVPAGGREVEDAWTGATYKGGAAVTVDAPLDRIPLLRYGARLPVAE